MYPWAMSTFRAMGSRCRIIAPDRRLVAIAEEKVRELEQTWSRFIPTSEISALNRLDGKLALLSPDTYVLVSRAEQARQATDGAFNPLMLDHLEILGYDASWQLVRDSDASLSSLPPVCLEPIELYPEICGVKLPQGTRFDPGGIGKGLAGDLVTAMLRDLGASSTQVELGGDVRVSGLDWSGGSWRVTVGDGDHGADEAAFISIPEGGIATSSSVRRSWRRGDRRLHHLLDHTTGMPADTDLAAATVVAPELWWAEVIAKVAVISGSRIGRQLLEELGMTGLFVHRDPTRPYETIETLVLTA
jgi:thiamine biosynthesis lipoprotein